MGTPISLSTRPNAFQSRDPDEPGGFGSAGGDIFSSSYFPTLIHIKALVGSVTAGDSRDSFNLHHLNSLFRGSAPLTAPGPHLKNYSPVLQEVQEGEISGEAGLMSAKTPSVLQNAHSNLTFISNTLDLDLGKIRSGLCEAK